MVCSISNAAFFEFSCRYNDADGIAAELVGTVNPNIDDPVASPPKNLELCSKSCIRNNFCRNAANRNSAEPYVTKFL